MISVTHVMPTSAHTFFTIISDYERYPKFIPGVHLVEVDKTSGQIIVTYSLEMLSKRVHYSLIHKEVASKWEISWELAPGENAFFRKNSGFWHLTPQNEHQCLAEYGLDLEFKITIPSFILNGLIKKNLADMMDSFRQQAIEAAKTPVKKGA